ncbi:acyltransferase family protein [Nostoc sp. CCY 9925]|uniref:acyltransferase family protein n=1 Tax=Nostoc sp. CCY 9925 TaxID=3103865 RepID=UPI0039C75922
MNKKLNLLQVYRGIAAILVVLSHGNRILTRELDQNTLLQIFHFGWIGVDFFFVLSGFIIFYIHQYDIGKPNKLKSFISKRFIRIYPLYWIVLTSKILASIFTNYKDTIYPTGAGELLKAFLLLPQDPAILNTNFIGVSWTLSYEIFFYGLFAALIVFNKKICRVIIFAWIAAVILNLFNLLPIGKNFLLMFIFDEHNLEFVLGCLAAYTISKSKFKFKTSLIYASIFMLVLSVINTKYGEFDISGIPPLVGYGLPFTLLIIGSVYLEMSSKINVPLILIYLGDASYSIYLTHGFLLSNVGKILDALVRKSEIVYKLTNFNIIVFITIVIAVAMGCLIHTYLEKPLIINLKNKVFAKIT